MSRPIEIVFINMVGVGHGRLTSNQIVRILKDALPAEALQVHMLTDPAGAGAATPKLIVLHSELPVPVPDPLAAIQQRWPGIPIFGLMSLRQRGEHLPAETWPSQLQDFVLYPFEACELTIRIRRALHTAPRESGSRTSAPRPLRIASLVGETAIFLAQVEKITLFAEVDAPVLLGGETGTGKELFARAIHYQSDRKDKAFIPINCAALPDQLFENELFGHVKGAYTGAATEQRGLVLEAEGGTLFLDEVDSLTPHAQAKLLRFVQDREYRPLGCSRAKRANVRILAASNCELRQAVTERRFREDLFHRLNVLSLVVPPLRDRREDIPLLATCFLERHKGSGNASPRTLSADALEKLLTHSWPGNVRELESILQRAVVLSTSTTINAGQIEFDVEATRGPSAESSLREAKCSAVMDVERAYLVKTLVEFRGNVTHAARAAGKERRSFQRLLRKYGIDRQIFQRTPVSIQKESPPDGRVQGIA